MQPRRETPSEMPAGTPTRRGQAAAGAATSSSSLLIILVGLSLTFLRASATTESPTTRLLGSQSAATAAVIPRRPDAADGRRPSCSRNAAPLVTVGLVADNHYDTYPAGEKAPWEPMDHWLRGQVQRTSTTTKRRYDVARDKMLETVEVFNAMGDDLTFAVNLGDLVNNDLMWNLRPILDAFNQLRRPHFNLLGNHDLRAHNDRFGKLNKTQEAWLKSKLGLARRDAKVSDASLSSSASHSGARRNGDDDDDDGEWYYRILYGPFVFIFLDSMVVEPETNDPPARQRFIAWLKATLQRALDRGRAVIVFGHISVGFKTNVHLGPILSSFPNIVGAFFGHEHRGGYLKQNDVHTVIIQGQIETLVNAFAVLDVFCDRMELTGFGRVPSRVMPFTNIATVAKIKSWVEGRAGFVNRGDLATTAAAAVGNTRHAVGQSTVETGPFFDDIASQGHQPKPPALLWKDEVLQPHPPLLLFLPNYRKPVLFPTDPNPGDTQFSAWYKLWPKRHRSPAPEAPVNLVEYAAWQKNGGRLPQPTSTRPAESAVFTSGKSDVGASRSESSTTFPDTVSPLPSVAEGRRPNAPPHRTTLVDNGGGAPFKAFDAIVVVSVTVWIAVVALVVALRRRLKPLLLLLVGGG